MTRLHIKCEMLLINCDTVGDKRFLKSVSTGLDCGCRAGLVDFVEKDEEERVMHSTVQSRRSRTMSPLRTSALLQPGTSDSKM